jgi:NAD(P)-dependent dehydrogenase (short-subunit alcohol dehydrogenase family)
MQERPRLAGAAALVTGGSSGIGLGLAQMLVAEGADVTIVARNPERLAAAGASLRERGGCVLEMSADVGSPDDVERAVNHHMEHLGRLDVLINSAGIAVPSRPARQQPAVVRDVLAVDLEAVILSYWAAMDHLEATARMHGVARVVNLASLTARASQPWLAVYAAAKAGVVNYTNAMNQAFAAKGVLSTAICPGFVDTPMSKGARDQLPDQMITTADVVETVRMLFALSPRSYVPEVVVARSASSDPSGL